MVRCFQPSSAHRESMFRGSAVAANERIQSPSHYAAISFNLSLGTPTWTNLSTNATCQREKTEKVVRMYDSTIGAVK